jgi:2-polyprenyl-6-methoxyphenol hydroxylase-like FAD-dependent oxidoreductase
MSRRRHDATKVTSANNRCEVLVVGAGPTGLMLALWLARLGVHVRVVDKNERPGTTSRALVVHARSLEFFQQLGIADSAVARGRKFAGLRLWTHGECQGRIALGDIGEGLSPFPYMLILPQDEQERLLIETLRECGIEVERHTELVAFEDNGESVVARLQRPDASEERCTCSYIAGCDGTHSTVRHALGVNFSGETYTHLFYVADVQAKGAMLNGELNLALDTSDFLAVFPLPDENGVRLIGTIEESAASESPDELRWEDVSPAILEHLPLEVVRMNWFSTYHVHHRVASRFRAGRAFLLGDAAHIHSPVGGQGMNTGLGDAVNLSWKLAMALRGRASSRLLDSYEAERIPFARRLVATTDRVFTFVTRDGQLARVVREELVPRVLPALLEIDSARRYMFRTVSQIMIEYRDSALSTGQAGAVHGGDRLPWTGGNFASLASLQWQVHVYGNAPEELADTCRELDLPLHTFPGQAEAAGLPRNAMCLVRPDGYVALVDAVPDAGKLRAYCAERGIVR